MIGLLKMVFTIMGIMMFLVWIAAVGKASHDMSGAHGGSIFLTIIAPLVVYGILRWLIPSAAARKRRS